MPIHNHQQMVYTYIKIKVRQATQSQRKVGKQHDNHYSHNRKENTANAKR